MINDIPSVRIPSDSSGVSVSGAGSNARTYSAVNDAINRAVFDGRHKLAPVYLDIESDIAVEIASYLDVPPAECLSIVAKAVAASLNCTSGDPYGWHIRELDAWNALERFEPPPFTALLALLSLAAERMREDDVYSAQNYYERLFELLGTESESDKNSLRQNAKSTKRFWDALNSWLAENDYDFGKPTAKRVNDWPYVSFALSQALVRDADRKRFHSLFADYGLAPREQMTEGEMSLYLHEWMRGPAASAWLKRIWAAADLRSRVASAACAELEVWEGIEGVSRAGTQRRRLSWAASLQMFPRRELRMFMSTAHHDDGCQLTLKLPECAAPAARAAFEHCSDGLWLVPSSSAEISVVEPVKKIALSPLMLASFELKANNGELSFHRAARAIVPLVKLDTGAFYREVSRVSFLKQHLVLCHKKWGAVVSSLLSLNARQGFSEFTSETLSGLPADWLLFSGVEMLRLPPAASPDMQALVPLSDGVSVEMAGGFRLSQNLWHASVPPEITAAAATGPLRLVLRDAAGLSTAESLSNGSSCRLTLPCDRSWESSDFTLEASLGDKVKAELHVSFRSADQPRRLSEIARSTAYTLHSLQPEDFLSADASERQTSAFSICGMTLHGNWKAEAVPELCMTALAGTDHADEEIPVEMEGQYQLHSIGGLQETCVLRGYHYWNCEPFEAGDDPRGDKWMTCNSCRNRVLTRNRGVIVRRPTRRFSTLGRPIRRTTPPMRPRTNKAISPDLIFDALCYLGSGTWRKLQDLVSIDGQPLTTSQKISVSFEALGHIDVSYDKELRSRVSWVTAPPALVFTPSGTAFLAGFRNAALIEEISTLLEKVGGIADFRTQEHAPSAYLWHRLSPKLAEDCLGDVRDSHGRRLSVTQRFTTAVAAKAPKATELAKIMPAIRLENPKDLQRFDPGRGSWDSVKKMDSQGAYRADYAGRRYIFRDYSGSQREGSFGLVKLLAAKAAGLRLHSYEPVRRVFKAVLGCELPGLYSRALIASSGLMPERVGSQLHYHGVDPGDASLILSKLYG